MKRIISKILIIALMSIIVMSKGGFDKKVSIISNNSRNEINTLNEEIGGVYL